MIDDREGQGFRQVGSLIHTTGNLRLRSGSTPTEQPQSSATTGRQSLAARGSSSTGPQLGATAAGSLQSEAAETDRQLLASLPPSVACALRERVVDRTTQAYGFDCEFVGYALDRKIQEDDRIATLARAEAALRPAPAEVVKSELARLKVTTKARAEAAEDLALTMAAYAEYLREYPADVVRDALRWWARNEKWWPAWAELKDLLERRVKRRRALAEALRRASL